MIDFRSTEYFFQCIILSKIKGQATLSLPAYFYSQNTYIKSIICHDLIDVLSVRHDIHSIHSYICFQRHDDSLKTSNWYIQIISHRFRIKNVFSIIDCLFFLVMNRLIYYPIDMISISFDSVWLKHRFEIARMMRSF